MTSAEAKGSSLLLDQITRGKSLREGSAVYDYFNPAITIIGTKNQRAFDTLQKIYSKIKAPVIKTDIGVAELIKYVNNSFHYIE